MWGRVSPVARALDCHAEKSEFLPWLVLLAKALYHACFICGQTRRWWSCRPKLTSSVISDVKPIIYIYILHLHLMSVTITVIITIMSVTNTVTITVIITIMSVTNTVTITVAIITVTIVRYVLKKRIVIYLTRCLQSEWNKPLLVQTITDFRLVLRRFETLPNVSPKTLTGVPL